MREGARSLLWDQGLIFCRLTLAYLGHGHRDSVGFLFLLAF